MKNIKTLLISVLMLLAVPVWAWDELPAMLDGSMALYDFDDTEPFVVPAEGTPAGAGGHLHAEVPAGLRPVYVSYLARHGARFLTSAQKVEAVESMLLDAQSRGCLTKRGRECLALLNDVKRVTAGRWGMLTDIGMEEERRLASDMQDICGHLLQEKNALVEGNASEVPRVRETMYQFFTGLSCLNPGIELSSRSGRESDPLTRFFASDSVYVAWRQRGDWHAVYDQYASRTLPVAPAERLVGKDYPKEKLQALSYDLYKVLQGLRAMGMEPPSTQWMTVEEYRQCWQCTNMQKYFNYSLSPLSTVPPSGAKDLLRHMVTAPMESLLAGNSASPKVVADCIFGHAETLLPLFSLLGVQGTVALPLDYDNLHKEWSDAVLTPLAANLAIVYLADKGGNIYVMMRLNGRNISPVNDPGLMMVSLSEFNEWCMHRLNAL